MNYGPNVRHVRHNYLAIIAAACVSFTFEAIRYALLFIRVWLNGTGRTINSIMKAGKQVGLTEWMQYAIAFRCAILRSAVLSILTQLTGEQSTAHGMRLGALVWFAFHFTTWVTEYVFEARPLSLLAVNTGYNLIRLTSMGAIVGGWKTKSPAAKDQQ